MAKANYIYTIKNNVICIVDLNAGNMSVTNDIENVVADICRNEYINYHEQIVVYQDSENIWDGWSAINGTFISLNATTMDEAINRLFDLKHSD